MGARQKLNAAYGNSRKTTFAWRSITGIKGKKSARTSVDVDLLGGASRGYFASDRRRRCDHVDRPVGKSAGHGSTRESPLFQRHFLDDCPRAGSNLSASK